eukprot:12711885-Ditylum_brightwellii.AAC.1
MGKSRINVQLEAPFGSGSANQMDFRVSTDQKTLLIGFQMSPFLSCSNYAFKNLVKYLQMFDNWIKDTNSYIL